MLDAILPTRFITTYFFPLSFYLIGFDLYYTGLVASYCSFTSKKNFVSAFEREGDLLAFYKSSDFFILFSIFEHKSSHVSKLPRKQLFLFLLSDCIF